MATSLCSRALLASGAEVNAITRDGVTMLMLASQNGHVDVAQALLASGADLNAKTGDGKTALSWPLRMATSTWCRRCWRRGPRLMPKRVMARMR